MKRFVYVFTAASVLLTVTFTGCKPKEKKGEAAATDTSTPGGGSNASEPVKYTLAFSPDSAVIGQQSNMLVKLKSGEAIELQDPDGKPTGLKVKIVFTVTNKNPIGQGSSMFLNLSDQRLQLDNGTNISSSNGQSDVIAQESSKDGYLEFEVPAGAKPVKLNLFQDQTRVSIALELSKK